MLNKLSKLVTISNVAIFFLALMLLSLFTTQVARALLSIAIGGFFVCSLFCIPSFKFKASNINLAFLVFTGVFFLHVSHYFFTYPNNMDYFEGLIFMKLPFLLLPIAFMLLPAISEKTFKNLLLFYLLVTLICSIGATINFLMNFEKMKLLYSTSKALPVAANHVRYSLMIVTAIFTGAYLLITKHSTGYWKHETKFLLVSTLFLFVFAHLLAVRSGLVSLYAACFCGLLIYLFKSHSKKWAIICLLTFMSFPIVAYFSVPTIRYKIENTITDLSLLDDVYSANYQSITARIFSYKVAFQLIEKKPFFGVGIGNLPHEVELQYIRKYQMIKPDKWLLPHNQVLFYLTAFGIVGTFLFMIVFYFPLVFKGNWKKDLFLPFQYLILSISFLVEGTLETQLGLSYAIIFILMALSYLKWKEVADATK